MANIQFQLRRGLASLWTSVNPTLAQGEMGVETDTNKIKIGNGNSGWTSLAYIAGDASGISGGITGPYVTTFNGLTGAVTGVCASNNNTFSGTQTFNGISCATLYVGGITMPQGAQIFGDIEFNNSISVDGDIVISHGTGSGVNSILASIAIGSASLIAEKSSINEEKNIAIGTAIFSGLGTGSNNIGIGTSVIPTAKTASFNIGIGTNVLQNLGSVGFFNSGGSSNIAIGYQAGLLTSTGAPNKQLNNSILIGTDTSPLTSNNTNTIVIGHGATGLGSNSTVIGTNGTTFARIYGLLDLPSGLSASGATFSNTVNLNSNTLYTPTLQYYNEPISSPGISGNTLSLDLSLAQVFNVSLNAGISSFIVTNVPQTASRAIGFSLFLTADGTARGISWGSAVKWPSGIPPTLTTTNNKTDILSFTTLDGGTSYFGSVAGQNY
jgi:hypothetical protein